MHPSIVRLGILLTAIALVSCGDDSGTNPDPDPDPDPNPTRVVVADPSFSTVIIPIFSRTGCTNGSCHGVAAQAGLELATNPYTSLVGVQSSQVASLELVTPNDTVNSYLVIKLEGTDPRLVQERMPRGGTPLDTIDMNNIKNWIKNGAQNN